MDILDFLQFFAFVDVEAVVFSGNKVPIKSAGSSMVVEDPFTWQVPADANCSTSTLIAES